MKSRDILLLGLLTIAVLVVHGYHPYADDASIYVAGVKKVLHPSLYTTDAAFVVSHGRLSLFSRIVATTCTILHLDVDTVLFLSYVALTATFFLAAFRLASRTFSLYYQAWMATLFLASCFTIPVAATSLLLMDPYLSARSFSAPFSLFAILSVTNKSWAKAALWLVATALLHPLMAVYLLAFLLVFFFVDRGNFRAASALCAFGIAGCAALYLATRNNYATASYREAALSRTYYFLAAWHWYEVLGVVLPIVLMGIAWKRTGANTLLGKLALTSLLIGSTCLLCSLCFVHPGGSYLLMRLQLLRSFHTIYALGILMLGGWIARLFPGRMAIISWAVFAATAYGMFLAQRDTYHSYPDIEFPGHASRNSWENALLWIRGSTPADAIFAAEPQWLDSEKDETPGFRAMAERSILTDKKDEGLASLFPSISESWSSRRDAEDGLDTIEDAERIARLRPYGVNWILLSPHATTGLSCPYRNDVITICKLNY